MTSKGIKLLVISFLHNQKVSCGCELFLAFFKSCWMCFKLKFHPKVISAPTLDLFSFQLSSLWKHLRDFRREYKTSSESGNSRSLNQRKLPSCHNFVTINGWVHSFSYIKRMNFNWGKQKTTRQQAWQLTLLSFEVRQIWALFSAPKKVCNFQKKVEFSIQPWKTKNGKRR